jgi:hypothetical protein
MDPGDDVQPALDGTRLAWVRKRADGTNELRVKELPDGAEKVITTDVGLIALSGNRVAWTEKSTKIFLYDLTSSQKTEVMRIGNVTQYLYDLALDGNRLVWGQTNPGDVWEENYDVYLYDIAAAKAVPIAETTFGQRNPMLDGDIIAWADDRSGHHVISLTHLFELYAVDLAAGTAPLRLTQRMGGSTVGRVQALDGGRAVFWEMRDVIKPGEDYWHVIPTRGTCELAMIDVRSGTRTSLGPTEMLEPGSDCALLSWQGWAVALSGNRLVMEVAPTGTADLVLVDVPGGRRRPITTYEHSRSTQPRLSGPHLVWMDDRYNQWDLFYMDLTDADAGDLFPEGRSP